VTTEGPYFRVERTPAKPAGSRWRASAAIVRTDIDEPVERLFARGESAEVVDAELDAAIAGALARLERPVDWGRDPTVPRLLRRYLALRDELYGKYLASQASGPADGPGLQREADEYEARQMKALEEHVLALTDAQLVELVTPTPQQLAHRDDADVLDLLAAKKRLAALASRVSPEVQHGRELLEQALGE
jgi:hypothetical protein